MDYFNDMIILPIKIFLLVNKENKNKKGENIYSLCKKWNLNLKVMSCDVSNFKIPKKLPEMMYSNPKYLYHE